MRKKKKIQRRQKLRKIRQKSNTENEGGCGKVSLHSLLFMEDDRMKKGEIYTGIVEKMDFPNKGILYIEDEKVVVKHGLP